MKKLLGLAAFLAGLLLMGVACQQSEPKLSVSPKHLTFKADDKLEQVITVETNASDWYYKVSSGDGGWITVYEKSGINNQLFVKVTDYTNNSASRTGKITFYAGKTATFEVTVDQLKRQQNTLSISPTSLYYEANEVGNKTVFVSTNATGWEASTTASWVQLTKQERQLVIGVTTLNTQAGARTADIVFKAGNAPEQICKVTQQPALSLSVSPTSLTFDPNASTQTITVTTNAPSWNASTTASWLTLQTNNNILSVTSSQNTGTSRSSTVTVTAGSASPVSINVVQNGSQAWPGRCAYTATGSPVWNWPGHLFTSWSGELIPNSTTTTPTKYMLTNWANESVNIYFDYVGGQFKIDRTTKLIEDYSGKYSGYLAWGIVNMSAQTITYYPNDDRVISYNASTRTFETGTFNGLPVFLSILIKNNLTGEWDLEMGYINDYYDVKITHSVTSSAPQVSSGEKVKEALLKRVPDGFKISIDTL